MNIEKNSLEICSFLHFYRRAKRADKSAKKTCNYVTSTKTRKFLDVRLFSIQKEGPWLFKKKWNHSRSTQLEIECLHHLYSNFKPRSWWIYNTINLIKKYFFFPLLFFWIENNRMSKNFRFSGCHIILIFFINYQVIFKNRHNFFYN